MPKVKYLRNTYKSWSILSLNLLLFCYKTQPTSNGLTRMSAVCPWTMKFSYVDGGKINCPTHPVSERLDSTYTCTTSSKVFASGRKTCLDVSYLMLSRILNLHKTIWSNYQPRQSIRNSKLSYQWLDSSIKITAKKMYKPWCYFSYRYFATMGKWRKEASNTLIVKDKSCQFCGLSYTVFIKNK